MPENTNVGRPAAPPLPATVRDLIAQRRTLLTRSLNDDVEQCHLALWEREEYNKLFLAIWREETIEGSFIADEIIAATMVRKYAEEHELRIATNAKLAAIVRSLHVVCNRYNMNRNHRRSMVGGQQVNMRNSDANDGADYTN